MLKWRALSNSFMPVIDENPACPRQERYKALAGIKAEGGLFAYQSPDGIHWSLMQEKPVITNGAFDSANLAFWDPSIGRYRAYWRTFTAGVTEKDNWKTKAARAGAPNELSFYASSGYWHGQGVKISRYTLRLDGFVSASAPMQGGELLTRVLRFKGSQFKVNFATSAAGTLKVEIQDAKGHPIPGYSLPEADETFGDEIDRTVSWNGSTDVSSIAGQPVRLRFTLQDADLYAFQFVD